MTANLDVTSADEAARSATNAEEPADAKTNDHRDHLTIGVAVLSGLLAATSGARPTGATALDVILILVSAGLVTWASATAPWWAVAGSAGTGAALALSPGTAIIGLAGFVAGLRLGVNRTTDRLLSATIGGVGVNTLIRSEYDAHFGVSAIVGISLSTAVLLVGLSARGTAVRRQLIRVVAPVSAVAMLAIVVSTLSIVRSRHDLASGQQLAREGFDAALAGDYVSAADLLGEASAAFEKADSSISNPIASLGRVVPVLAQHQRLVAELAATGSSVLADAQAAMQSMVDADLTIEDGAIDLDGLESTLQPLRRLDESIDSLVSSVSGDQSGWLISAVDSRLTNARLELDAQSVRLDHLVEVAERAPALLGADGARTYFVGFSTPAEARGVGGLIGNFAELQVDDGQISLVRFGRTGQLNGDPLNPLRRVLDGPAGFLDLYGGFGFVKPDGGTGLTPWSNVTMPADFRLTADVIAQLYPQSGGRPVDGVILLDAFVLDALAGFGGPLQVPSLGRVLEPGEVAPFLLYSQYELDVDERVDLLDAVARATLDRLLGGLLPPVPELGFELAPLAQQHRIVAWMVDDDEQAMIERLGLSGRLPDVSQDDGLVVTINNASGNKIDAYLERRINQRSVVDPSTGLVRSTTTVTLTNTAPATGLPDLVIGNGIGAPPGTNRTMVSVYTPGPARSVDIDGQEVQVAPGRESGWTVVSRFITLEPGGSSTITVVSETVVDLTDGYRFIAQPQPLVIPAELTVDLVVAGDARAIATTQRVVDGRTFVVPVEVLCPIRNGTIDVTSCTQ